MIYWNNMSIPYSWLSLVKTLFWKTWQVHIPLCSCWVKGGVMNRKWLRWGEYCCTVYVLFCCSIYISPDNNGINFHCPQSSHPHPGLWCTINPSMPLYSPPLNVDHRRGRIRRGNISSLDRYNGNNKWNIVLRLHWTPIDSISSSVRPPPNRQVYLHFQVRDWWPPGGSGFQICGCGEEGLRVTGGYIEEVV